MTIPTDGRIDLDALAELAKKATPGPWRVASDLPAYAIMAMTPEGKGGHRVVQTPNQNNYRRFGPSNGWDGISQIANAAFIAALDPQTVLALIDLARRAEAKADDRPDPTPNSAFDAWVASLPKESWAKYDLSACRLGWDAARRAAIPSEQGEAVGPRAEAPEGWKLVPVEPTLMQQNAGWAEVDRQGFATEDTEVAPIYRAMLSVSPSPPDLDGAGREGWQPIETAPKDGTRVILNWGGAARVGYYLDNSKTNRPWQGWKVPSMEEWPAGQPIAWMPFPLPLKETP